MHQHPPNRLSPPHPLIRIVMFLTAAVWLTQAVTAVLLTGVALLGVWFVLYPATDWRPAGRMLLRLRWLLLSLLVVYLWFTPGTALIVSLGAWSPTQAGLELGARRCAVLVLLVIAVHGLLLSMSRVQLLGAIYQFTAPLALLGLARERLAVRLMLTLEAVPQLQPRLRNGAPATGNIVQRIGARAGSLFAAALSESAALPVGELEFPAPKRPPLWQWLLPVSLAVLFARVV